MHTNYRDNPTQCTCDFILMIPVFIKFSYDVFDVCITTVHPITRKGASISYMSSHGMGTVRVHEVHYGIHAVHTPFPGEYRIYFSSTKNQKIAEPNLYDSISFSTRCVYVNYTFVHLT